MSKDKENEDETSSYDVRTGGKKERVSLYQCMQRLMADKGETFRQQHFSLFQMAQNMAEHIIQNTYTNDSLYQSYIRTQNGKVHLTDFRMLDEQTYKCNVSLKVPRPVNSFTNHYKRPQEIPPHRMLVTLGENLDRVDRVYQRCLWEDCLDDKGIIRPDYVLKWFNKGLLAYCDSLKHSKHKEKLQNELKCDFLEISTETHKDKTIYGQITMGNDENDTDKTSFKINFVPTLTLRHLPNQIKLRAPFPDRQQYFENRDNFRKDVLSDIKRGIPLLCLEARIWMPTKEIGFNKSTSSTWAVGCSSLDAKGIEYISHLTDSTTIENITLLMGKIRHEHLMGLNPVSNPLVCNAILHVHRKNVGKFVRGDQWFLAVLKIIATQLQEHFAPSFFINSMNLLEEWDETYLIWMGNELKKIVKRLRRKPRLLDFYVGAKRRVGFLLDSSQDLSAEGNETVKENEKLETDRRERVDHNGKCEILSVIAESEEEIEDDDNEDVNLNADLSEEEIDIFEEETHEENKTLMGKMNSSVSPQNDSVEKEIKPNAFFEKQKTIFVKQITDEESSEQQKLSHIYC